MYACRYGHLPVVRYLMTLCDDYCVTFDSNNRIVNFKVVHDWATRLNENGQYKGIGICNICDEKNKKIYGMKCVLNVMDN